MHASLALCILHRRRLNSYSAFFTIPMLLGSQANVLISCLVPLKWIPFNKVRAGRIDFVYICLSLSDGLNDASFLTASNSVVPIPGTFSWPLSTRGKPRRGMLRRAVFSDVQRKALEKMFQKQKYISKPDRKKLAAKLGLKDSQVNLSLYKCKLPVFPVLWATSFEVLL